MDLIARKLEKYCLNRDFSEQREGCCIVCDGELPPRRRVYCTDRCANWRYVISQWTCIRFAAYARDLGHCVSCGAPLRIVFEDRDFIPHTFPHATPMHPEMWYEECSPWPHGLILRHLVKLPYEAWPRVVTTSTDRIYGHRALKDALGVAEVDHILATSLGGSNELSNLRTLCRRCHKRKTRRDFRKLSTGIRPASPGEILAAENQQRTLKHFMEVR